MKNLEVLRTKLDDAVEQMVIAAYNLADAKHSAELQEQRRKVSKDVPAAYVQAAHAAQMFDAVTHYAVTAIVTRVYAAYIGMAREMGLPVEGLSAMAKTELGDVVRNILDKVIPNLDPGNVITERKIGGDNGK